MISRERSHFARDQPFYECFFRHRKALSCFSGSHKYTRARTHPHTRMTRARARTCTHACARTCLHARVCECARAHTHTHIHTNPLPPCPHTPRSLLSSLPFSYNQHSASLLGGGQALLHQKKPARIALEWKQCLFGGIGGGGGQSRAGVRAGDGACVSLVEGAKAVFLRTDVHG